MKGVNEMSAYANSTLHYHVILQFKLLELKKTKHHIYHIVVTHKYICVCVCEREREGET
ncbi:hypothetical protein Hanom_Chr04g00360931 [Helianthus anomalus]